MTQVNKI